MVDTSLVGRCGLYCGACCIYRAHRDSGALAARLAELFKSTPEEIRCNGCGALTKDCWGTDCKFIQCQEERGYRFCYVCPEYKNRSCVEFEEFAGAYLDEDGVDIRSNLALIEEGKLDEWLAESEKRYTCPHCGRPLIVGREKCHHCDETVGAVE